MLRMKSRKLQSDASCHQKRLQVGKINNRTKGSTLPKAAARPLRLRRPSYSRPLITNRKPDFSSQCLTRCSFTSRMIKVGHLSERVTFDTSHAADLAFQLSKPLQMNLKKAGRVSSTSLIMRTTTNRLQIRR